MERYVIRTQRREILLPLMSSHPTTIRVEELRRIIKLDHILSSRCLTELFEYPYRATGHYLNALDKN